MSSEGAFEFAVVCEAAVDQETACDLADRVLEESADWIKDYGLDSLRCWCGVTARTTHVTWKSVPDLARGRDIRMPHGHFDGAPGQEDAKAARRAIWLFLSLDDRAHALLLVRDSDKSGERLGGLKQARAELSDPDEQRKIAIAVAITKRECWVLNGFEPKDRTESRRLQDVRRDLGFDPTTNGHRLTAEGAKGKRNAKRVLRTLTQNDAGRMRCCWRETAIETLRAKGEKTGLRGYLDEVEDRLVPIIGGRAPATRRAARKGTRRRCE